MYKIDTKTYGEMLVKCYETKAPLFIYGAPGIGKSEVPRQIFPSIADKMKRTFVEWTNTTHEEKMECIANPEKYWVFCDQRVGQMDSTDLRGIPNMINAEMLETIPMSWIIYFTSAKAAGTIFFDELNLAAPVVAGQAYQIINDRAISDRKLSKDVFVFGAGNRAGVDQAYVQEMPFPLRDRFCEVEVYPDVKNWTENFASKHVNPHLVAFVQWKQSYLFKVDESKTNKSSTPRGIARASKLIEGFDVISPEAHMYISISVGEAFATEFQAYTKCYSQLNWKTLFENPDSVKGMKADMLWAVVGGLGEKFAKLNDKKNDDDEKIFNNIMSIVYPHLRKDFAIVAIRLLRDSNANKFAKYARTYKDLDALADMLGKYIL